MVKVNDEVSSFAGLDDICVQQNQLSEVELKIFSIPNLVEKSLYSN